MDSSAIEECCLLSLRVPGGPGYFMDASGHSGLGWGAFGFGLLLSNSFPTPVLSLVLSGR